MSTAPLEKIIHSILRPGFLGLLHAPSNIAARSMESRIKDIATTDLNRLANLRSEPAVIEQLITSLARATASEVPSQHCARTYHGRYPHRRRPPSPSCSSCRSESSSLRRSRPGRSPCAPRPVCAVHPSTTWRTRHWLPPRCTLTPAASAQTRRHSVSCSSPLSSTIYWPTPRPWEGIFTTIATPTGTRSTQ